MYLQGKQRRQFRLINIKYTMSKKTITSKYAKMSRALTHNQYHNQSIK